MAVKAPLRTTSLISPCDEQNSIKAMAIFFDTKDEPKTFKGIQQVLDEIKLSTILSENLMNSLTESYEVFLHSLAQKYLK